MQEIKGEESGRSERDSNGGMKICRYRVSKRASRLDKVSLGILPSGWRKSIMVPLYKRGEKDVVGIL